MMIDQGALTTMPQLLAASNNEVRETAFALALTVNESLGSAKYLMKIGCLIPVLNVVGARNEDKKISHFGGCLLRHLLFNVLDLNSFCREGTENYRALTNTLKQLP